MRTRRNQLLSAVAVFAIAMVLGGWATSTRGGEEDMPLTITALVDGNSSPWTLLAGGMCAGTASVQNDPGNLLWKWSSTHHFNATQRQVWASLGYTSEWQLLEAWNDLQYASDDVYIDVDEFGAECEA